MLKNFQEGLRPYIRLENVFLPLFLIFGVLFVLITPPGQNPDEFTHVFRALQVADGRLVAQPFSDRDNKDRVGGHVSKNVDRFFDRWSTYDAYKDVNFRFDRAGTIKQTANLKEDKSETTQVDFNNTAVYSPLAYAPQLPAIWLSRVLDLSIYNMILLGRLLGLLAVAAAIFLALKIVPIGKWIIFVIALLPSTVSQSAAFSADGVTIAAVILGIAYILKLALDKKTPSRNQWLILLLLCASIGVVKPSYLPVLAFALVIPLFNSNVRTRRNGLKLAAVLAGALLPFIVWSLQINFIKTVHSDFNPTANYYAQRSFVVYNPVAYGKVLYRTFFTTQQDNTYRALFGNFGWNYAPLPPIFVFGAVTLLTLSVLVQSPREIKWRPSKEQSRLFRLIALGVFVVCTVLVATAIYLSFNNVRRTSIDGIQGRYLLPPLLLLLLAFYGNRLQKQRSVKNGMVIAAIIILAAGALTAYSRYYLAVPPYY